MDLSDALLRQLAQGRIVGNFPPFSLRKRRKVEAYVAAMVKQLAELEGLLVEPDFPSYSIGFASHGEVRISKMDKSDTMFVNTGPQGKGRREDHTDGLVLYISTLAPYWFYGGSRWLATWQNGQWKSASAAYLRPESMSALKLEVWQSAVEAVKAVLESFGYMLLAPETLARPAPIGLAVPTILADAPYQLFDCLFYWED